MKTLMMALILASLGSNAVLADETWSESAANAVDETKKDAKKTARKADKEVRDATGNKSVAKDVEDGAKNVTDEAGTAAKKAKREID